ncbi:TPA: hypothetical protein N0F65_008684 [Lagenidium giganteum]|uniref:Transposase n=1 Tax=Lagenidium giganteum TaxID=4803 RepID=A0AAV2Z9G9_9STRA|nr:TPA: hypothetical protein N0F65_008684 [Lagenidium giganteum]
MVGTQADSEQRRGIWEELLRRSDDGVLQPDNSPTPLERNNNAEVCGPIRSPTDVKPSRTEEDRLIDDAQASHHQGDGANKPAPNCSPAERHERNRVHPPSKCQNDSSSERETQVRYCLGFNKPCEEGSLEFDGMMNAIHMDEKNDKTIGQRVYLATEQDGLSKEATPTKAVQSKSHITKQEPQEGGHRDEDNPVNKKTSRPFLLEKLLPAIREKWPEQPSPQVLFLQQDNASPHVHPQDKEVVEELASLQLQDWCVQRRQQPAQSPDLNVLDLGFFHSIQTPPSGHWAATLNKTFLTLQSRIEQIIHELGSNDLKPPRLLSERRDRDGALPWTLKCDQEAYDKAREIESTRKDALKKVQSTAALVGYSDEVETFDVDENKA